jgi:hypothetical protein
VSGETTEVKRFDGEILGFLMQEKNRLTALRPAILELGDVDALDELDGTLEETNKTINAFCAAGFARDEARTRYKKWEEIVPKCREALRKSERLARDVERAGFHLSEMRSKADDAFDKVMQARDRRIPPARFPDDAELEQQAARERKAEAKHSEAVARVRDANEAHQAIIREQWQHKLLADALLFQERQLRPRETQTERGVGELSAVR